MVFSLSPKYSFSASMTSSLFPYCVPRRWEISFGIDCTAPKDIPILLAMFCRFPLLSHMTRVCTTLTFSSAVASLGWPDRPSSSTLSLRLLNSAAHFSLCYKKNLLPNTFHEGFMYFLWGHSFLTEVLEVSPFWKCVAPSSLESASHKQPIMTTCFSHSQCPSIRSNDRLTKV